ncbi:ribonuclease III [Syntrophothermus lipocalidus DSM 12680]|uniref:Mini-ribonuclease 3 n=1 Tax=Syntrophothermus lipocalidus (strain DSM 12680 / TGB-C1) TaxID=643648 RepID=D7CJP4_SYNLT|nr:ribonuclease III [Syntrophothermus lipocalidus DSM 12680]
MKTPEKGQDGELKLLERFEGERVNQMSPVLLAYVGDAVYELYVRTQLLAKGNRPVGEVHRDAVSLVRASTQARLLKEISPQLSEEEKDVIRRARNNKRLTPPRNVDISDYRLSTGLEALFGYLYLKGEEEKLNKYMSLVLSEFEKLEVPAI